MSCTESPQGVFERSADLVSAIEGNLDRQWTLIGRHNHHASRKDRNGLAWAEARQRQERSWYTNAVREPAKRLSEESSMPAAGHFGQ